jgi:hypothetical protein
MGGKTMVSNTSENFQIDKKVLTRIHVRVIHLVHENLKTDKYSSTEISDKIRKIIEVEVDKNEN